MHFDPLKLLTRLARQYGDICHFRSGRQHVYSLNHPDLVKEVLLTQNHNFSKGRILSLVQELFGSGLLTSDGGERHLAHRRAIQPGLRNQRISALAEPMIEYALQTAETWQDGQTLDMFEVMMRLTLRIFAKAMFDLDYEHGAPEMRAAMQRMLVTFDLTSRPYARSWMRLPTPAMRRFKQARALIAAAVYRMMRERGHGEDHGDLLSVMMQHTSPDREGAGMSEEQIRDEVFTFIIAGNYTTASMLTWTWYLLAQHPGVQERLHAELDRVLQGRPPTIANMNRLPYARMVLCEALRMYPPVWLSSRWALRDCELGGYRIPAGAIVMPSQYVVHRDPRFYPEPERFDPERWTPEAEAQRPRHAFFPFAAGPRSCVGERFAWMEGLLVLATLAQRWRFEAAAGFRVKVHAGNILRPKDGLMLNAHKREP